MREQLNDFSNGVVEQGGQCVGFLHLSCLSTTAPRPDSKSLFVEKLVAECDDFPIHSASGLLAPVATQHLQDKGFLVGAVAVALLFFTGATLRVFTVTQQIQEKRVQRTSKFLQSSIRNSLHKYQDCEMDGGPSFVGLALAQVLPPFPGT